MRDAFRANPAHAELLNQLWCKLRISTLNPFAPSDFSLWVSGIAAHGRGHPTRLEAERSPQQRAVEAPLLRKGERDMPDRYRNYGEDHGRGDRERDNEWGGSRGREQSRWGGNERNEEDRYVTGRDFETNQPRYSNERTGNWESESRFGGREHGGSAWSTGREYGGGSGREYGGSSFQSRGWQRGNEPGRWNNENEADFRTRNYGSGSSFGSGRDTEAYSRYGSSGDYGDYQRNRAQSFGRHESGGRYGQSGTTRGSDFGGSWGAGAAGYGASNWSSGRERDFDREDWNDRGDDRFDSGRTSARDFSGGGYAGGRGWERSGSYGSTSPNYGTRNSGIGQYSSGRDVNFGPSGYDGYVEPNRGFRNFDRDRDWERDRDSGESWGDKIGRFFGMGPKGYKRSDDRIREDVSEALHDDPNVDATNIEVQVREGEVTLTGTCSDRRMKRLAEDCAGRVRGVNDVHNQIRVSNENRFGGSSFGQSGTSGTNTASSSVQSSTTSGTSESTTGGTESGKKPNKAA